MYNYNENDIIGVCRPSDDCVVATIRHSNGSVTPIPHIVRHSPDGFEFGYGGSGPADLALSILTALVGAEMADVHYQDFKWLFIAPKSGNGFTIPVADIFAWLASQSDSDPDGDHASEDLKAHAHARPELVEVACPELAEGSISYQEDY